MLHSIATTQPFLNCALVSLHAILQFEVRMVVKSCYVIPHIPALHWLAVPLGVSSQAGGLSKDRGERVSLPLDRVRVSPLSHGLLLTLTHPLWFNSLQVGHQDPCALLDLRDV